MLKTPLLHGYCKQASGMPSGKTAFTFRIPSGNQCFLQNCTRKFGKRHGKRREVSGPKYSLASNQQFTSNVASGYLPCCFRIGICICLGSRMPSRRWEVIRIRKTFRDAFRKHLSLLPVTFRDAVFFTSLQKLNSPLGSKL